MTALLPIMFAAAAFWYFARPKKPSRLRMNKRWTYVFLATYVGILLIATVATEFLDTKINATQPKIASQNYYNEIDNAIYAGNLHSIDPSQVIDKRTHKVSDTLTITTNHYDIISSIHIERKNDNDGLVVETIFKPRLFLDKYDFSDKLNYVKPEWNDASMKLQRPPNTEVSYAIYQNPFLLEQFTNKSRINGNSFISSWQQPTIHLLVPKDLVIIADESLYIEYINDWLISN